jgi:hypothetical protein
LVYSFEDVQATINGPGGSFSLGSGSGNAQEGISCEFVDNKNNMLIGADGSGVHSKRASKAGRVIVRLLKTSPVNAQLSQLYTYQDQPTALYWGQNIITVTNPVTGDDYHCTDCAFEKHTGVTWAQDANINEWVFDTIKMNPILGTGF